LNFLKLQIQPYRTLVEMAVAARVLVVENRWYLSQRIGVTGNKDLVVRCFQQRRLATQMDFHLKLVVPSDPRFLSIARNMVSEVSAICGLPEEACQRVTLALDEALANVIRHAYKNHYDQEIELDCQVNAERIVFRLLDEGEPPDPAMICGQPLNDVSLSGRGTHLMRAIMDEMSYKQTSGKNELRLVKNLPRAQ
jgi:anti-sigma regulatory factor (Ser/Thr protein kinase)